MLRVTLASIPSFRPALLLNLAVYVLVSDISGNRISPSSA